MAKRTRRAKDADRGTTVRAFPHELRPGDVYRDAAGVEWTVTARPTTYRAGKRVTVDLSRHDDPSTTQVEDWAAHERVSVRRPEALKEDDEK